MPACGCTLPLTNPGACATCPSMRGRFVLVQEHKPTWVVPMPQTGWKCPQCGAVMAPAEKACINCKGVK